MARLRFSVSDVLSAALASVILGALLGGAVCLAIMGFGWWAGVPSQGRWQWAFLPSLIAGGCMSLYMIWLFISGKLLPEEIWQRIGGFFEGINDGPV